jgi:hypothetical protein
MNVTYGPPGHKGVTQIMGLGTDEAEISNLKLKAEQYLPGKAHRQVAGFAAGAWLVGLLMGSSWLQSAAIGAGAGILACAHLMKQEGTEELPEVAPLPVVESLGAHPSLIH